MIIETCSLQIALPRKNSGLWFNRFLWTIALSQFSSSAFHCLPHRFGLLLFSVIYQIESGELGFSVIFVQHFKAASPGSCLLFLILPLCWVFFLISPFISSDSFHSLCVLSFGISGDVCLPIPCNPHVVFCSQYVSWPPASSQTFNCSISRICSLEIFFLFYFLSLFNISNHFSFGPALNSLQAQGK